MPHIENSYFKQGSETVSAQWRTVVVQFPNIVGVSRSAGGTSRSVRLAAEATGESDVCNQASDDASRSICVYES